MYQENVTALKKDAPIGVFDSGIGGLTVAREIMRQIPNEKIIYFGDTARMPYGSKSKETVTRFSKQIVRFLETFQVKTIVVACNTASAYALDELDCANCGLKMEEAVRKIEGVKNVNISFMTQKITLEADDADFDRVLKEAVKACKKVEPDCRIVVK